MKAPFIFMNTDSEYFYIFPDVFFFKKWWSFYCKQEKQTMAILFARLLFEEL